MLFMKKILVQALRLCTLKKTILSSTLLYLFILGFVVESKAQPASIQQFFPVYGITLGKTTTSDLKNLGYFPETFENGPLHFCMVKDIYFWDNDGNHVYEGIYMTYDPYTNSIPIPNDWRYRHGFDGSLSYSEWQSLFTKLGFSINVTEEPTTEVFNGVHSDRNTLSAKFIATSLDGALSFELKFDYGNGEGEGYSVNSKNSLYSIKIFSSQWASTGNNPQDNYTQQQNAIGPSKEDTEKWLAEKLYGFSCNSPYTSQFVQKVEVRNCEILVSIDTQETNPLMIYHGLETIPISSVLSYAKVNMGVENVYLFRGNIEWIWRPNAEIVNISASHFMLRNVPDDMLERIQKALEYYRKMCGGNEPF